MRQFFNRLQSQEISHLDFLIESFYLFKASKNTNEGLHVVITAERNAPLKSVTDANLKGGGKN